MAREINIDPAGSESSPTQANFNFGSGGNIWSSVIDAGLGIYQTYQQKKENQKNRQHEDYWNERSFDFESSEAEKAYERQKKMYDYMFQKENDYNSPRRQAQRLKEAGFNPAILAGTAVDAGGSAVSSPSVPQASSPSFQSSVLPSPFQNFMPNFAQLAGVFSQMGLNSSQKKKLDKESSKIDSEISLTDANVEKVKRETQELVYKIEELLPNEAKLQVQELNKIVADINNSTQITQAQCNEIAEKIRLIIEETSLKSKENSKAASELAEYDEFIKNKYKEQKYRSDMTQAEFEYYDSTKSLRTRIMNEIKKPDPDMNQLILDAVMYFLTLWMH